jgi:hypothetical protein
VRSPALMGSASKSPPQTRAPAKTSGSSGDIWLDAGRGAKSGTHRRQPLPAAPSPRGWRRWCGRWGRRGSQRCRECPPTGSQFGSQSGDLPAFSSPATGPLSCGFGGAPRGIRTPNRQIRSLVLCVGLVGSRRICPAHVGYVVGRVGSRRVPSDRLDDQPDDQASQALDKPSWVEHKIWNLTLYPLGCPEAPDQTDSSPQANRLRRSRASPRWCGRPPAC